MHTKTIQNVLVVLALLACGALGNGPLGADAVAGLTGVEADGYLQWLHSLEKSIEGRQALDQDEGNLLYPFDLPGWTEAETRPYRHLAISKAVTELETQWRSPARSHELTALAALSNARNYVNLSEYDSALVWYEIAGGLDTVGTFRRELGRESLAAAAAAGDSLNVAKLLTNTMGLAELTGREGELIVAYRWLLTQRDSDGLDLLIQKTAAWKTVLTDRLCFWHAYALAWRQRQPEARTHLRQLIRSGGLSRDLTESQRAWVLAAMPDLLFLAGDHAGARELYEILSRCSIASLAGWGQYQVANLDFLAARYLSAANGFTAVCRGKRMGSWQDHACSMVDIAEELERIRSEGEPYGAAAFYTP